LGIPAHGVRQLAAAFLPGYKTKLRATPLESTHMEMSTSVDSKALTETLSLLDATLMKKQGVGHR
jgi:hypothetical protein